MPPISNRDKHVGVGSDINASAKVTQQSNERAEFISNMNQSRDQILEDMKINGASPQEIAQTKAELDAERDQMVEEQFGSDGEEAQEAAVETQGEKTSLERKSSAVLLDILKTTGKKQDSNEYKYRIMIQFEGNDKNYYDDTLAFTVYRLGFIKSGTIFYLRTNITPVLVEQIKMDINHNKPVKLKLFIWSLTTDTPEIKLKNKVLERPMILRKMDVKSNAEIERGNTTMVDLWMCGAAMFAIDRTYSYNKILSNVSPYEALQDYEGFLKSTYGDNFESKHILGNKNEHKYPQLVTKPTDQDVKLPNDASFTFLSKTDSGIPLYLNYKYKIDNALSFYFFDGFNMKSKKELTCVFLSFADKNKFEKFKIEKQADISEQSQYTKSFPFYDPDRTISNDNIVDTSKLPNAEYKTQKTQRSMSEKGATQVEQKTDIISQGDEKRFFQGQITTMTAQENAGSANANSYQIPDSKDASDGRVNAAKDLFNKGIEKIDEFSTNNCGFDWLQFGFIYSMNTAKPNEFLHTPIAIVNIFHRDNTQENVLSHMARFLMVKYYGEEGKQKDEQPKTERPQKPEDKKAGPSEQKATQTAKESNKNSEKNSTQSNKPIDKDTAKTKNAQDRAENSNRPRSTAENAVTQNSPQANTAVSANSGANGKGPTKGGLTDAFNKYNAKAIPNQSAGPVSNDEDDSDFPGMP